jgi:hypothetical protein
MKKITLFIFGLLLSVQGFGQVKAAFDEEYQVVKNGVNFGNDLILLNQIVSSHSNPAQIDAMEAKDNLQFVTYKATRTANNFYTYSAITLDLREGWKEIFQRLSDNGKINTLKAFRNEGKLKFTGRFPSNTVEIPQKTNPRQSYSSFYLSVISTLMQQHKGTLSEDHLDFALYQKWEAEASLKTESDLIAYRLAFIRFLYKHYYF